MQRGPSISLYLPLWQQSWFKTQKSRCLHGRATRDVGKHKCVHALQWKVDSSSFLIKKLIKNVSRIPAALADQPGKKMTAKIVGAAVDSEVKKNTFKK